MPSCARNARPCRRSLGPRRTDPGGGDCDQAGGCALSHVAALTTAVRAAYRLRDSLAHSALVEEGLDEQGWRLEGRRRGVERSIQVSLDEVTNTVEAGKNALDELIRLCGAPTKPT
jgi:hypothetical protein